MIHAFFSEGRIYNTAKLFGVVCILWVALLNARSANAEGQLSLVDTFHRNYHLEPGSEVTGVVWMANTGDELLKARVYLQDFSIPLGEEPVFSAPATLERSNAGWIHVPFTYFEVPPFTRFPVCYVLRVPKEPRLEGSYWSTIMIESAENATATAFDGTCIQVAKRFAHQMVVEVGDLGTRKLEILDRRFEISNEIKRLVIDVKNEGTLTVKTQPFVTLIDGEGKNIGSFSCPRQTVQPSCSSRFHVNLSSIDGGLYHATIVFRQDKDCLLTFRSPMEVPNFLSQIQQNP